MEINTILYIITAAVFAFAISYFYYFYKSIKRKKVSYILTFLRFISIFLLFLLFINPTIKRKVFTNEKPQLSILVDNSSSISYLKSDSLVIEFQENIKNNSDLNKKYDIQFYSFGESFSVLDTISFDENQTNLYSPLRELNKIQKVANALAIVVSDGNQTLGTDYLYVSNSKPIYTVVVGDTSKYVDLKINRLNTNKYTYLKNKFPVEVFIQASGIANVNTQFSIFEEDKKIYSQKVLFKEGQETIQINTNLLAKRVGVHYYKAVLSSIDREKNILNNTYDFVVEVVDEQSEVLILYSFLHPDVGALQRTISSNKQRKVSVAFIDDIIDITKYNTVILYQPTAKFENVFGALKKSNKNHFIITGTKTDWNFLNKIQSDFTKDVIDELEYYRPIFNTDFNTFQLKDIGFEEFPPLKNKYGAIRFKSSFESILYQELSSYKTTDPLLAIIQKQKQRIAILFGEGFWNWSLNAYRINLNEEPFNDFTGKIIQFLSADKKTTRLIVDANKLYFSHEKIILSATFLDENYVISDKAIVSLELTNKRDDSKKVYSMLYETTDYTVNLSPLEAGDYAYKISVDGTNISQSGDFKVLAYNIEQQFVNANYKKLNQLAINSEARSFLLKNSAQLVDLLLKEKKFKTIQKESIKYQSLVDWKVILILIILSLSIEWFVRKYNGLI